MPVDVLIAADRADAQQHVDTYRPDLADAVVVTPPSMQEVRGLTVHHVHATSQVLEHPRFAEVLALTLIGTYSR